MTRLRAHVQWEVVLFVTTLILYGLLFLTLSTLDRNSFDLDGNPAYAFPVHGQDSPVFVSLAENLVAGKGFIHSSGNLETFRTPGYPALLALSLFVSGGFTTAIVIQILMAAMMIVLVYRIGVALGGSVVGIISGIATMLSPNVLFHSLIILSDIPVAFFVVLAVYLVVFNKYSVRTLCIAGIVIGIAAYIRPVALYLPILLIPIILYRAYVSLGVRTATEYASAFLFCFLVLVIPWHVRNSIEAGVFGFSSISAYNFAGYNIPLFLEDKYGRSSDQYRSYDEALKAVPPEVAHSFEGKEQMHALTAPIVKNEFWSYTVFHGVETATFFLSSSIRYVAINITQPSLQKFLGLSESSPDLLGSIREGKWSVALKALSEQGLITLERILLVCVSVLAVGSMVIQRRRFEILALLAVIGYFAVVTGPVSIPRYRLPVEPFIFILAISTTVFSLRIFFDHIKKEPVSWPPS
jgi:hypothetical protein